MDALYNEVKDDEVLTEDIGEQAVPSNQNIVPTQQKIIGGSLIIGEEDSVLKADNNGLYLGNKVFADAPFSVTPDGDMIASSISTASSGKRISIQSNVIEFYSAAGTNIVSMNGGALGATTFLRIDSPAASPFEPISIVQKGEGKDALTIVCEDYGAGSEGIHVQQDGDDYAIYIENTSTSAGKGVYIKYSGSGAYALQVDNPAANNVVAARFDNTNASNANNTVEASNTTGGAGHALHAVVSGNNGVAAVHFKQSTVTSTNFWRTMKLTGGTKDIYVWVSNGTDPNGALSGAQGDVCYNCSGAGVIKYCSGGTTWV